MKHPHRAVVSQEVEIHNAGQDLHSPREKANLPWNGDRGVEFRRELFPQEAVAPEPHAPVVRQGECSALAEIDTDDVLERRDLLGFALGFIVPSPSCPVNLFPQAQTVPSGLSMALSARSDSSWPVVPRKGVCSISVESTRTKVGPKS